MTVFVVGNAAVDLAFRLDRLPEAGETRIAAGRRADPGGKGLNQAIAARRAGARVRLCAAVGDDPDGRRIAGRLAAEGIPPGDLVVAAGPTDQSVVWVAEGGENMIVSTVDRARGLSAHAAAAALAAGGPGDVLLLQGNLGLPATAAALAAARDRGLLTVLNPAPVWPDGTVPWPQVDVAVVNRVEARQLTGAAEPGDAARALCRAGAGAAVVTLGARGALAFDGAVAWPVPAPPVAAVDTSGAGDTFCGVLAAMRAGGRDLADAVRIATGAAALSVTRPGALAGIPPAEAIAALAAG